MQVVPVTTTSKIVIASGAGDLLSLIRPEWQAKALIKRVVSLLSVDPSSACQRLLNAAIHDLRAKIVIAGLDVAEAAASQNRLPVPKKTEDVQEYSTTNTLDLAYYMGLVSRAEWRRLKRAYDIRKDLEHEDDQYEASIEDCIYIFRTCIEIVLSRDPISPVKVVDIKKIIESPGNVSLSHELIADFSGAPDVRQVEIFNFLISTARNEKQTDVVRQNAVEALRGLKSYVKTGALAKVGQEVQERLLTKPIGLADMKVSAAAGITPYLKQSKVRQFFEEFKKEMDAIGYSWTSHAQHGKLLDKFEDIGGFSAVPEVLRQEITNWAVLCYIGEPGGYGQGISRPVFFSNVAAPRLRRLFKEDGASVRAAVAHSEKNKIVKAALTDPHIRRRYETICDLVSGDM